MPYKITTKTINKDGVWYTPSEWCKKLNQDRFKGKPYKATYTKLKIGAKRRGKELTLSYNDFLTFTKIEHCHYCAKRVIWVKHGKVNKINLDRKDNSKGYSLGNCVVSCWDCNNSRSNIFSYQDWFNMTKYLRKRSEFMLDRLYDLANES